MSIANILYIDGDIILISSALVVGIASVYAIYDAFIKPAK